MERRTKILGLVAVVAVAVVAVLVLRGGDEGGENVRGDVQRLYPLRGSLAGDDDAIDGAADAWREQPDTVVEADEPVYVLWIGAAPGEDRDVAIMSKRALPYVAEAVREDGGDWEMADVRYDPPVVSSVGAPMPVGDSVLVPDSAPFRYASVSDEAPVEEADGLFRTTGLPGIVLPDLEQIPDSDDTAVLFTGLGESTIYGRDFARMVRTIDDGGTALLYDAVRAGDAPLDRIPEPARYDRQNLHLPWAGRTPGGGEGLVVALERAGHQAMALARRADAATRPVTTLLGTGETDQFDMVAARVVDVDGTESLVLAGSGAREMTVRVGDDEPVTRPGPIAFLDPPAPGDPSFLRAWGTDEDGDRVEGLHAPASG